MKKYKLIWYDIDEAKQTDFIEAENEEDARKKGYSKYNGNPPAKMLSIVEEE